jgi:hypothetical protein
MVAHAGCPLSGCYHHAVPMCSSMRCRHMTLRLPAWRPSRLPRVIIVRADAEDAGTEFGGDLTESQLARLEKAEREAAMLREQLKQAQQIQVHLADGRDQLGQPRAR